MSKPKRTHIENTARRRIERMIKRVFLRLGYVILPSSDLGNERIAEYPWTFGKTAVHDGQILDVGCSGSDLSTSLAGQGFNVIGIDVYKKNLLAQGHPNFNFVSCDARWLPFVDKSFDFVVAVSTVEHIGIGYYGDLEDYKGDNKAVKEFLRVCKKLGKTLVTVPYGKWAVTSMQRTYDGEALKKLAGGLEAEIQVDYFVKRNCFWLKSSKENADQINSSGVRSVACITLMNRLEGLSLRHNDERTRTM